MALYTYIAMQGFHFLELITFLSAALLSHLLPFMVGALVTLLLAGMGVKYFLNPLIKPNNNKSEAEIVPQLINKEVGEEKKSK